MLDIMMKNNVFSPRLMWSLPGDEKWEYSNRFEHALSTKVLEVIGGSIIDQTDGYDPTKDITWDTVFGRVDVEIKSSAGRSGFIEAGRQGFTKSGLSATTSHLYLHLSVDNPNTDDLSYRHRKVKVRIYSTWTLIEAYMKAVRSGNEQYMPPSQFGPGSYGFNVDSFEHPHAYVGDLLGYINNDGDVEFDLDTWTYKHIGTLRELRGLMIGVQKHDANYHYEHKEIE